MGGGYRGSGGGEINPGIGPPKNSRHISNISRSNESGITPAMSSILAGSTSGTHSHAATVGFLNFVLTAPAGCHGTIRCVGANGVRFAAECDIATQQIGDVPSISSSPSNIPAGRFFSLLPQGSG
jgi:hypothetical protein